MKSKKITAKQDGINYLMRTLFQLLGNKRYLHDLEPLLEKLGELTPHENETLLYLSRDLSEIG